MGNVLTEPMGKVLDIYRRRLVCDKGQLQVVDAVDYGIIGDEDDDTLLVQKARIFTIVPVSSSFGYKSPAPEVCWIMEP